MVAVEMALAGATTMTTPVLPPLLSSIAPRQTSGAIDFTSGLPHCAVGLDTPLPSVALTLKTTDH